MLTTLAVANYRSLRNLIVPLRRLNLITGPNSSGKSSVYRALRLLADTAQGGVIPSLAPVCRSAKRLARHSCMALGIAVSLTQRRKGAEKTSKNSLRLGAFARKFL